MRSKHVLGLNDEFADIRLYPSRRLEQLQHFHQPIIVIGVSLNF